jgi:hypothetical protein
MGVLRGVCEKGIWGWGWGWGFSAHKSSEISEAVNRRPTHVIRLKDKRWVKKNIAEGDHKSKREWMDGMGGWLDEWLDEQRRSWQSNYVIWTFEVLQECRRATRGGRVGYLRDQGEAETSSTSSRPRSRQGS